MANQREDEIVLSIPHDGNVGIGERAKGDGGVKDWKPWDDYRMEAEILPIKGPPCATCKYWKPQREYDHSVNGFRYTGVLLCHSEHMEPDFSCYRPRESEGDDK